MRGSLKVPFIIMSILYVSLTLRVYNLCNPERERERESLIRTGNWQTSASQYETNI